jgi:hypothetical protein
MREPKSSAFDASIPESTIAIAGGVAPESEYASFQSGRAATASRQISLSSYALVRTAESRVITATCESRARSRSCSPVRVAAAPFTERKARLSLPLPSCRRSAALSPWTMTEKVAFGLAPASARRSAGTTARMSRSASPADGRSRNASAIVSSVALRPPRPHSALERSSRPPRPQRALPRVPV